MPLRGPGRILDSLTIPRGQILLAEGMAAKDATSFTVTADGRETGQ